MTPKEKAKELVDKMYGVTDYQAKQSALILVEEIIDNSPWILDIQQYWKEVKQEIQKL